VAWYGVDYNNSQSAKIKIKLHIQYPFYTYTRYTQSAQENASRSLNELAIEYPKRWHKHAAAADDDKSKLR
jgi:tellurite resistance-related uncharacterized protein